MTPKASENCQFLQGEPFLEVHHFLAYKPILNSKEDISLQANQAVLDMAAILAVITCQQGVLHYDANLLNNKSNNKEDALVPANMRIPDPLFSPS